MNYYSYTVKTHRESMTFKASRMDIGPSGCLVLYSGEDVTAVFHPGCWLFVERADAENPIQGSPAEPAIS